MTVPRTPEQLLAETVRKAHADAMMALAADVHPYSASAVRDQEALLDSSLDALLARLEAVERDRDEALALAGDFELRLLVSDDAHTGDPTPDGCDDDGCTTCTLVSLLAALAASRGTPEAKETE